MSVPVVHFLLFIYVEFHNVVIYEYFYSKIP